VLQCAAKYNYSNRHFFVFFAFICKIHMSHFVPCGVFSVHHSVYHCVLCCVCVLCISLCLGEFCVCFVCVLVCFVLCVCFVCEFCVWVSFVCVLVCFGCVLGVFSGKLSKFCV